MHTVSTPQKRLRIRNSEHRKLEKEQKNKKKKDRATSMLKNVHVHKDPLFVVYVATVEKRVCDLYSKLHFPAKN